MSFITEERAARAAVIGAPRLRTREEAKFRRTYGDSRTVVEPANRIFIHITVSNPKSYASDDAHARAVEAIGIARFPATGISYNRLLMLSGALYEGQPMGRRGAHTVNDFQRSVCSTSGCPSRGESLRATGGGAPWNLNYNARAYAVCAMPGMDVPSARIDEWARLIASDILAGLIVKGSPIHGHRCVSAKSCPGDEVWTWMDELARAVDYYVSVGLAPQPQPEPPEEDEMKATISRYGSTQTVLIYPDLSILRISTGTANVLAGIRVDGKPLFQVADPPLTNAEIDTLFALQDIGRELDRDNTWLNTKVSRGGSQLSVLQDLVNGVTNTLELLDRVPDPVELRTEAVSPRDVEG